MKEHYDQYQYKPKKPINSRQGQIDTAVNLTYEEQLQANSIDPKVENEYKDLTQIKRQPQTERGGILSNKYEDELRSKQQAKIKLAKIAAYQKSINELYKPMASEKKKLELLKVEAKRVTNPREKKPHENYLGFVRESNQQNRSRPPVTAGSGVRPTQSRGSEQQNFLSAVASLPIIPTRQI